MIIAQDLHQYLKDHIWVLGKQFYFIQLAFHWLIPLHYRLIRQILCALSLCEETIDLIIIIISFLFY